MNYQINNERVLFTQLGDEGVLYDSEKNNYFSLNETFYRIWQELEKGKTENEIVETLSSEFDVSKSECKTEVENALKTLIENEYISLK